MVFVPVAFVQVSSARFEGERTLKLVNVAFVPVRFVTKPFVVVLLVSVALVAIKSPVVMVVALRFVVAKVVSVKAPPVAFVKVRFVIAPFVEFKFVTAIFDVVTLVKFASTLDKRPERARFVPVPFVKTRFVVVTLVIPASVAVKIFVENEVAVADVKVALAAIKSEALILLAANEPARRFAK